MSFRRTRCRLWGHQVDEKLDKDRFRRDPVGCRSYTDVAKRLGVMSETSGRKAPVRCW